MYKTLYQKQYERIEKNVETVFKIYAQEFQISGFHSDGSTFYVRAETNYAIEGKTLSDLAQKGITVDFISKGIQKEYLIQFFVKVSNF